MIKSFQIGLWSDFRRRRWRKVLYRNLSAFTRVGSSDKMVINKKTRLEKFPRNTGSRLTSWQNIDKIHWKVKALLENREPPKRQFFFLVTVFVFLYRIQRFFKVINNITNNDKFWQKRHIYLRCPHWTSTVNCCIRFKESYKLSAVHWLI